MAVVLIDLGKDGGVDSLRFRALFLRAQSFQFGDIREETVWSPLLMQACGTKACAHGLSLMTFGHGFRQDGLHDFIGRLRLSLGLELLFGVPKGRIRRLSPRFPL